MARIVCKGLSVSAGVGLAPVFRLAPLAFEPTGERIATREADAENRRLETACGEVRTAVSEFRDGLNDAESLLEILGDPLFRGSMRDRIESGLRTAEDAVVETVFDLKVILGEVPDPLVRARAEAAEEAGRLVLRRLHGADLPLFRAGHPVVLVTDEMTAFDATRLHPDTIAGVVCARGGVTSHFAIIAKQLGIPVVSGIDHAMDRFEHGEMCVCDGSAGVVTACPDPAECEAVTERLAAAGLVRERLTALARSRTATRDGQAVDLWGNIAGPADVQPILDAGGTGVGMFRTEFIFEGDEPPSEERQAFVYRGILERTPGPVVMRTLEAGGDKTITYLAGEHEENPNLGWQGLRMCLDTPELFLTQLRAMIRASVGGDLWIMFPFVSARWELDACRALVAQADADVRRCGVEPGNYKVGVMVEIPAAAVMAREYLRDFDFCSIGTNDLTQFTLAADRMNPRVARWYDPFHPGVLRLIAMTAAAARAAGKPLGMAGDMAGNPLAVPFLIGLGFTSLSVTAPRIPEVKETILSVDAAAARLLARRVLEQDDVPAVMACLRGEDR